MAECPSCKEEWLWDWCMDTYRTKTKLWSREISIVGHNPDHPDGWATEEKDKVLPLDIEGISVTMIRCKCGKVLAFEVLDDDGSEVFNHPEWKDINWEKDAI